MASPTWESLLDRIRQWMIVRFALNTERDWMVWMFVVGTAAHLEHLGVAVLWVDDGQPVPFPEYEPHMTLGRVARTLRQKSLLDAAILDTVERISALRNSVAHRDATWGIPFQGAGTGEYKGRHVFTDPQGLNEVMTDMDAATKAMNGWLREHGLTGDQT